MKSLTVDCLFLVEFDDNDKCKLFREWWHLREVDSSMFEEAHHENP